MRFRVADAPAVHEVPSWLLMLLKAVVAVCLLGMTALWSGMATSTPVVLPPTAVLPVSMPLPLRPANWPPLPGNRTHAATKLVILAHFSHDPSWAQQLPFPVEIYSSQVSCRVPACLQCCLPGAGPLPPGACLPHAARLAIPCAHLPAARIRGA